MSLDKTNRRLQKIREQNRRLRWSAAQVTEPGPWFSLGRFPFNPSDWPGLTEATTPEDDNAWPLTRT